MEIKEAIAKSKILINKKKELVKKTRQEILTKKDREKKEEIIEHKESMSLLGQLEKRAKEAIKDKEILIGILFLEKNKRHFRIHDGRKSAIHLCPNGTLKRQLWGMYMGDNYIQPLDYGNIDSIGKEDLKKIINADNADFKKML